MRNTSMKAAAAGLNFLLCLIFILSCDLRTDIYDKSNLKKSDLTVEFCSPADQSLDVTPDARISVVFSHRMNRESVYRNFHVIFAGTELGRNDGSFEWFDEDRVFFFTPFESFPPLTRVSVFLDSEVMDVDHRQLLDGYSFCFFTAENTDPAPLTAELLSPDTTEPAVDIFPHIVVSFNRQIQLYTAYATFVLRSLDSTDVRSSSDGRIDYDGSIFTFIPKTRLKEDTEYIVEFLRTTVNGTEVYLQDLAGNEAEFSFESFHTTGNILYVSPAGDDGESGLEGHPKRTIGSAVVRAQELGFDSTVIMIAGGDYHENITLTESIVLRGGYDADDFQTRNSTTALYPLTDESTLQILGAHGCTVDGLTIYGSTRPFSVNATVLIDSHSDGVLIFECELYSGSSPSSSNNGIWIHDSSVVELRNSHINCDGGTSSCGVYVEGSVWITIHGNDVYGGSGAFSCGVLLENSGYINLHGNRLHGGSGTSSCGLSIESSHDVAVSGCSIRGGTGDDTLEFTCGVYLKNLSGDNSISGCSLITGGDAPFTEESVGIYIDDTSVRVFGSTITGGAGERNIGIVLSGSQNHSVIENNNSIEGGGEAGELIGIEVSGSAAPVIRDNALITGGSTLNNDATGMLVADCATPRVYRNTILGGSTISGSQNSIYGVRYVNLTPDPGDAPDLFNNFIIGGSLNTQVSDICYAVYLENRSVCILNNTIDGGGNSSGYRDYGVFCRAAGPEWTIEPVVINNYILGGNGDTTYGIYLDHSGENLACAIFNNLFNSTRCQFFAGTGMSSISEISALNSSIGAALFEPDPDSNDEDTETPSTVFENITSCNYHLRSSPYPQAQNKGYNAFDYQWIYSREGALFDIDGEARETAGGLDYSLIDLGADELL